MTSSPSRDDILELAVEIFEGEYSRARSLHLRHEALSGERSVPTLANFRDALDHMSRVVRNVDDGDFEEAEGELGQVRDHLERVIYDGSKSPLESTLSDIEDHRLPYILYRIAFLEAPTDTEYRRRLRRIRELYYDGRDQRKVQSFEEATDLAVRLRDDIPSRPDTLGRIILLGGALITSGYVILQILP